MALEKAIVLDNGITVNYHRVVSVNNVTNRTSIIEVSSYTSAEKREEEKEKLANNEHMDIFIYTEYLSTEYNETMNVVNAYDYLKGLEKYQGATDV